MAKEDGMWRNIFVVMPRNKNAKLIWTSQQECTSRLHTGLHVRSSCVSLCFCTFPQSALVSSDGPKTRRSWLVWNSHSQVWIWLDYNVLESYSLIILWWTFSSACWDKLQRDREQSIGCAEDWSWCSCPSYLVVRTRSHHNCNHIWRRLMTSVNSNCIHFLLLKTHFSCFPPSSKSSSILARNKIQSHLVLIYYKDHWLASLLLIHLPLFFLSFPFLSFFPCMHSSSLFNSPQKFLGCSALNITQAF